MSPKTLVVLGLALCTVAGRPEAGWAGSHPLSKFDKATGCWDLVVGTDWIVQEADEQTISEFFKLVAQRLYAATEGQIKLGKVHVYPMLVEKTYREHDRADIILSQSRSSWADQGGFGNVGRKVVFVPRSGFDAIDAENLVRWLVHYGPGCGWEGVDTWAPACTSSESCPNPGHTCYAPSEAPDDKHCIYLTRTDVMTPWDCCIPGLMAPGGCPQREPVVTQALGTTPTGAVEQAQTSGPLTLSRQVDYRNIFDSEAGTRAHCGVIWSTAHQRMWCDSCWMVMVTDPATALCETGVFSPPNVRNVYLDPSAYPATAELKQPTEGWETCEFKVIFEGTKYHLYLLDTSGSMGLALPDGSTNLSKTQKAAGMLMSLWEKAKGPLGKIALSVVAYAGSAYLMQAWTDDPDDVNNQVGSVVPDGGTNFDDGLDEAGDYIDDTTEPGNDVAVTLFTDGEAELPSEETLEFFRERGIPVDVVSLGPDVDPEVLEGIANATGGTYYPAANAEELADNFAAILREATGDQVIADGRGSLVGGEHEVTFPVSPDDDPLTVRVNLDPNDPENKIKPRLVMPDGTVVTPDNLPTPPPTVTYEEGPDGTWGMFTVSPPDPGIWTSVVASSGGASAEGEASQEITSGTPIKLGLQLTGEQYPEPLGIVASLRGPEPVINATLVASIVPPEGAPAIGDVVLRDDGEGYDRVPNDGLYSGAVTNHTVDGRYHVTAVATNPTGTAQLYVPPGPFGGGEALESLPAFRRVQKDAINISGFREMPLSEGSAQPTPADNSRQWGALNSPEEEVWYSFEATAGEEYCLMTSNLASSGDGELQTEMTLIDPDGNEIESSKGYNGGDNSLICFTAEKDGTYKAKVGSANGGTGRFAFTVGPDNASNPLDPARLRGDPTGAAWSVPVPPTPMETCCQLTGAPGEGWIVAGPALALPLVLLLLGRRRRRPR